MQKSLQRRRGEPLHNGTQVHTLSAGPGRDTATMHTQVIQQRPRPGLWSAHMTPQGVCERERKAQKETGCECSVKHRSVQYHCSYSWPSGVCNNKPVSPCGQRVLGTGLKKLRKHPGRHCGSMCCIRPENTTAQQRDAHEDAPQPWLCLYTTGHCCLRQAGTNTVLYPHAE